MQPNPKQKAHTSVPRQDSRYSTTTAQAVVRLGSFPDGVDDLDLSGFSVHAVGIIPFGSSGWELFGQLGYGKINQKISGFYDEDDNAGAGGIGVRWHINPKFALAAQVDVYVWQNDDIGSAYDLSVGTNQIGVLFIF
jgi:hypothetical protein